MPSNSSPSLFPRLCLDISSVDINQDPFDFLPFSLPEESLGISIPTQVVEDAIQTVIERSDGAFIFPEPDVNPCDRSKILEDIYNDLLCLYQQGQARQEQLSDELMECKSRIKPLYEEYEECLSSYTKTYYHLEQHEEGHMECKTRLKQISKEHADLRYGFIILSPHLFSINLNDYSV